MFFDSMEKTVLYEEKKKNVTTYYNIKLVGFILKKKKKNETKFLRSVQ